MITACRLSEAETLREALRRRSEADLAFIVTDDLYRDVIRHDFGSLPSAEFTQVKVSVKEYDGTAWMYLPASGPVQETADATAALMWRATTAGALVAGLALFRRDPAGPGPLSRGARLGSGRGQIVLAPDAVGGSRCDVYGSDGDSRAPAG